MPSLCTQPTMLWLLQFACWCSVLQVGEFASLVHPLRDMAEMIHLWYFTITITLYFTFLHHRAEKQSERGDHHLNLSFGWSLYSSSPWYVSYLTTKKHYLMGQGIQIADHCVGMRINVETGEIRTTPNVCQEQRARLERRRESFNDVWKYFRADI